jgi:hypothetical protein
MHRAPTLVIPAQAGTQKPSPPNPTPVWGIAVAQNCRTEKSHPKQTQRLSAKVWGIEQPRIYGAAGRGIIQPMTRARNHANGVRSPSLPQLWLTAMLRAFVELVLNVASTFRMKDRRSPVNATPTTPLNLPQRTTDTHQETNAVQQDSPPIALILSSARSARPSKDEGVLTTPSVSLGSRQAIHLPQCCALMEANSAPSLATKGNCLHHSQSGGGGSPRLRGETEGARATRTAPTPNKNAPA